MIVEFRASDRILGVKAIGIYRKGIEAATSACDKVYVPTLALQTADSAAEAADDWLYKSLEDMEPGEARELTIPGDLNVALRSATSCYLSQLTKLAEKQTDLLVPPEGTNDLMSQLQSLADRLSGQTELAGVNTVTITSGGMTTGPLAMGDLENASRHMAHTAKGTAKNNNKSVSHSRGGT